MTFPDILMTLIQFALAAPVALMLGSKQKPPFHTCLMTGSLLSAMLVPLALWQAWLAIGATAISSALWFVLTYQQLSRKGVPMSAVYYQVVRAKGKRSSNPASWVIVAMSNSRDALVDRAGAKIIECHPNTSRQRVLELAAQS